MGCASSKHRKQRCLHCRRGYSPVDIPRSQSVHVHHPPQHSEDSCHVVALSSSSLGSLKLCDGSGEKQVKEKEISILELQAKLMEAKVWSSMMDAKIPKTLPKTPNVTPPGEPETINTWEMMDGLEDFVSPLRSPNHLRTFSFDCDLPKEEEQGLHFDPGIISSFRKSLQQLPSHHPFHFPIHDVEKEENLGKEKVILYFTSLRGIRKTYEECCAVRAILKSLRIRVDERDVSMHSGFKDELRELLGDKFNNGLGITLPRVFLGRKYLGGPEEIRKLNEDGKLEKLLEGCEKVEANKNGCEQECDACGDIRFVLCETCSGRCKVYYEYDDEEEDDQGVKEKREYGFQKCPDCNENGLIRCPLCCT